MGVATSVFAVAHGVSEPKAIATAQLRRMTLASTA
jgi:hypothetical protein